jgi:hypothetical protein
LRPLIEASCSGLVGIDNCSRWMVHTTSLPIVLKPKSAIVRLVVVE